MESAKIWIVLKEGRKKRWATDLVYSKWIWASCDAAPNITRMSSAAPTYRQRASSYEEEDRYAVGRYGVGNGNSGGGGSSSHLYSAQDLHRFSQNADRFTTNVREESKH